MKIEGNQKELDAMVEFHKGNRVEGLRLQEEFAAEFRKEYKDKDHCPCLKACRYHGNCKECVAIHRAHQEHVPNCMRPLINKKLKLMSELTEHTLANEIEAPHEILRKQTSQISVCQLYIGSTCPELLQLNTRRSHSGTPSKKSEKRSPAFFCPK